MSTRLMAGNEARRPAWWSTMAMTKFTAHSSPAQRVNSPRTAPGRTGTGRPASKAMQWPLRLPNWRSSPVALSMTTMTRRRRQRAAAAWARPCDRDAPRPRPANRSRPRRSGRGRPCVGRAPAVEPANAAAVTTIATATRCMGASSDHERYRITGREAGASRSDFLVSGLTRGRPAALRPVVDAQGGRAVRRDLEEAAQPEGWATRSAPGRPWRRCSPPRPIWPAWRGASRSGWRRLLADDPDARLERHPGADARCGRASPTPRRPRRAAAAAEGRAAPADRALPTSAASGTWTQVTGALTRFADAAVQAALAVGRARRGRGRAG